jgi:hypothetical protein
LHLLASSHAAMIVKHKVFDFGLLLLFLVSLLGSSGASSATSPLAAYGKAIELPFPNDWDILGVSGLTYNKETDFWTCSAENIPGTDVARQFPTVSLPRLYHMRLDFKNGAILEVGNDDSSVLVDPSQGLKLEDVTQAPPTTDGDSSGNFVRGKFAFGHNQQVL